MSDSQKTDDQEEQGFDEYRKKLNVMTIIEYLLEYVALFDFVSDLIVVSLLMQSKNTLWAAQLVIAMIAPLLVCSIQMIEFLLGKVVRRDQNQSNLLLMMISWTSIGPMLLIFLFIMD